MVDTRKAIAVLAYLAVTGVPASRERLCAMLWPESSQSRARSALRRTLSSLRAAVGASAVDADRESVGLVDGRVDVDVVRFDAAADAAAGSDLRRAAVLYRGDLLAGFAVRGSPDFEDWHRAAAEAYRRRAGDVFTKLVHIEAGRGRPAAAIGFAERLLELDNLNETAHRLVMLCEALAGRRGRAIARYRDAVRILEHELGVPPLPETTDLYERIRRGERPEVVLDDAGAAPAARPVPDPEPLIGRDDELAALLDGYRSAAFAGRVLLVEGEAGIGKSRLAAGCAAAVDALGGRVAVGRCHPGETDLPYAPLSQLFDDLARAAGGLSALAAPERSAVGALVPDLAPDTAAMRGEGPGAKIRFFEALRGALVSLAGAPPPGLLVVDDVHLADAATLEFVAYLVRRIASTNLALVVTRDTGEPVEPQLGALLTAIAGDSDSVVVKVGRLGDADVRKIVDGMLRDRPDADVVDEVVRLSEGVPLIAGEYARSAVSGTDVTRVPDVVRHALEARLARLGDVALQIVAAAAVLGRAFPPSLVRRVAGRTAAEVDDALDELERRSILARYGSPGSELYDFTHGLIQEAAHVAVPAGRRRLLHRRAAEALSRRRAAGPAQVADAARHAEMAGDTDHAAALYALAGSKARSVYANAEAAEYIGAALTLGHDDPGALHAAMGDLATLAGDYRAAINEYEAAAAVASGPPLADLEQRLGRVHARLGDWAGAKTYFEAAMNGSGDGGGSILSDLAITAYRSGDIPAAVALSDRALRRAEAEGDAVEAGRAANVAGLLARAGGDPAAALDHFEHGSRLATQAGSVELEIAALNNRGLTLADLGDHAAAERSLREGLALGRTMGDRHREAALLSNLGDVLFALDRRQEAAESVRESAAILAEIGSDDGRMIPEVWMMQEW